MTPRKKQDAFLGTALDEEFVLLNTRTGQFHGMGAVALAVWNAIDGVRTLAAIQAMIADRYDVERATCFAEVAAFVADLQREGLVDAA